MLAEARMNNRQEERFNTRRGSAHLRGGRRTKTLQASVNYRHIYSLMRAAASRPLNALAQVIRRFSGERECASRAPLQLLSSGTKSQPDKHVFSRRGCNSGRPDAPS